MFKRSILFLMLTVVPVAYSSCPTLAVNFAVNYDLNLQLTGQKGANQQLFYEVVDDQNNIVVKRTPVTADMTDIKWTTNIGNMYQYQGTIKAVNYIFRVYGQDAQLSNGKYVNQAATVKISFKLDNLYVKLVGKYEGEWYGTLDGWAMFGKFGIISSWHPSLKVSVTDKPSDYLNQIWKNTTISGECSDLGYALHTSSYPDSNTCHSTGHISMSDDVKISVTVPYSQKYISISKYPEPATTELNYQFN